MRRRKCPSRHPRRLPSPEGVCWPRDGGTYPCEVVGHRLSHRPPDIHRRAFTRSGSSSRTSARAARECVNTRLRDPPDLRCRLARHLPSPSVQPVARLDCLSWGCPKIAPPSSWRHRSPLPEAPLRDPPSGRACHSSSVFRPRGFPPPRRFAPPMPCACIATRSRPWGSSRFQTACPQVASPTARPSPGCLPCPSKPSPRP